MDKGQLTGVIYIDLSKAFDTISHASIVNKLPSYGITGISQQWFTSYLFSRMQQVSYRGSISSPHSIYCGVPQGSILGPLLFLLHFNDSTESLSACSMLMYADDTVVFFSDKDINVIQKRLESDFSSLTEWLAENELFVNSKKGKTEVMVFGTSKRLNKLDDTPLKLKHNGVTINVTNSYKYLGLTLTSSLNMTEHLTTTLKKASSRIHLLRKMRNYMDSKTAILIYQSMIVPILTYCPLTLYGSTPPYIKNRIAAMEDHAQFIIGNGVTIPTILVKTIETNSRFTRKIDISSHMESLNFQSGNDETA